MTCRDTESLLPLFFDGELDAKRMRDIAVHATRCDDCEGALRDLESMQEQLQAMLADEVDAVDMSDLWPAIEGRLPTPRASSWLRLQAWWEDRAAPAWGMAVPATAAAAALAVLALVSSTSFNPAVTPDAGWVASTDYATSIERLETSFDSVAIFSDPDTRTTVLWITDESPEAADAAAAWEATDFE